MQESPRHPARARRKWNADPAMDYAWGPDDAGNSAMFAVGFVVSGWRWLVGKPGHRA